MCFFLQALRAKRPLTGLTGKQQSPKIGLMFAFERLSPLSVLIRGSGFLSSCSLLLASLARVRILQMESIPSP
jgi:hypothetical protein